MKTLKTLEKTNSIKIINILFLLIALTLLSACGEDKEAYEAWTDKYAHVPCSYDDFVKTKPRGNTCFENEVNEQLDYSEKKNREKGKKLNTYYSNNFNSTWRDRASIVIREHLEIDEASTQRKEYKKIQKKYRKNPTKEIRKNLVHLSTQIYNNDNYPKLKKIVPKLNRIYGYSKNYIDNIYYPNILTNYFSDEILAACNSHKSIASCSLKKEIDICNQMLKDDKSNSHKLAKAQCLEKLSSNPF